jgi:hypothetical protein
MANWYGSMPGNVSGGFQLFKGTTARTGGLGQFRPVPHNKQQGTSQTSRPVHDWSVKVLALAEDGRYPSVTGARPNRGGVRQAAAVEDPEVMSIKDQIGAGVVHEDVVQAAAEGGINGLHVGQPGKAKPSHVGL